MSTSAILRTTALALAVSLTCRAAQAQQRMPATPAAGPSQADTSILPAQEIGTIVVGQTRRGTLEPGDWTMSDGTFADVWYLVAQSGQRVTIELVSRSFDSYLQLLDPGGTRLADNDDGLGRDRGARIVFTARAAGRYQIVVNNYDEDQRTGAYTLTLR